jgi:hypothetical protein
MGDGSRASAVLVLALASAAAGLAIVLTLAGRALPGASWKLASEETFEDVTLPVGSWLPGTHPSHQRDDGLFGDRGEFFRQRGTMAPDGYRITERFGGERLAYRRVLHSIQEHGTRRACSPAWPIRIPASPGTTCSALRRRSIPTAP